LATLERNRRHQTGLLLLFEAAREFHRRDGDLPEEVETLCATLAGPLPDRWGNPGEHHVDFFEAKGYVEALLAALGVDAAFVPASEFGLLPGRTAQVRAGDDVLGVIGQIHPETAMAFDLDESVFLFELRLPGLLAHVRPVRAVSAASRYPEIAQDLAVVVDADVPAGDVEEILRRSRLVVDVRLFDVYTGDQVGPGKKSLAFRIHYQAADHTLTDEEVAKVRQGQVNQLQHLLTASIRGL
jgi:phenylalanyl-tRNA synthetase beta chain